MHAVLGHATDDHRDGRGIAQVDLAEGIRKLRWHHDLLGGHREGDIEIDRIDHMHLGAALDRLAQALVQQRDFMTQVGADDDDRVGLLDFRHRHRKGFRGGAIGQIQLADAVVEVAGAQRLRQAGQQRALLVRGRRMHQDAEVIGGVVAQDPRGLGQRFVPRRLAEIFSVANQRHRRAVGGVQAFMRVAVAIRQPALIDRFVVARHAAQDLAAARGGTGC
jgi:hypothetical protein